MIPIGTRVRFKPANGSRPWEGVVSKHLSDTQVECDNSGSIPVCMLEPLPPDQSDELVKLQQERHELAYAITGGEDAPGLLDSLPVAVILEIAASQHRNHRQQIDENMALISEVAALQEIIVQQCELIAELSK